MAKGPSKAFKAQAYDELSRQNILLNMYLHDTAVKRVQPDVVERWAEETDGTSGFAPCNGRVELYRATGAHGGYVVIAYEGDAQSAVIKYMDEAYRDASPLSGYAALREAIAKLYQTRNRMVMQLAI